MHFCEKSCKLNGYNPKGSRCGTASICVNYVYFYERGLQLLSPNGIHTFICSNSWLDVNYGAPLQKYLLDNTTSAIICHSEAEREFESADINTIVSILQNGTPNADSHLRFLTFKTFIGAPEVQNRRERTCTYTELTQAGTAALDYIEWGEAQGFHQRPSCKGRPRWWDLGQREMPLLAFNYLISSTARTLYARNGCYTSDNFQEIHIGSDLTLPLCASLNSSLFQLMVNMAGRSNFGGGLLKIQTYEVSELLCLDPKIFAFEDEAIFTSTAWEMLDLSDDRRALDAIIFDALDLTQGERDGVYESVVRLVESRLRKARSLKGK